MEVMYIPLYVKIVVVSICGVVFFLICAWELVLKWLEALAESCAKPVWIQLEKLEQVSTKAYWRVHVAKPKAPRKIPGTA
jgi:hypothetical protein